MIDAKSPKSNGLAKGLIRRTSSMFDGIAQINCAQGTQWRSTEEKQR